MATKASMFLWVVVIGIILLGVLYFVKTKKDEGFLTYYGPRPSYYDERLGKVGNYDHLINDQPAYEKLGRMKYNKFSDSNDIGKGNFLRTEDEGVIAKGTELMRQSMNTTDPTPSQYANTLLGLQSIQSSAELAPANGMMLEAKKCEALRSREKCSILDDPNYANCGVCLKGGTPYSYENPGKHIGGLLIVGDDRQEADLTGELPEPSIGDCPVGKFFINKQKCEREANRLDCSEAGESGGFDGGRTVEGRDVISSKCAQVPKKSLDTFIYEPKTRSFNLGLRALTPTGTGRCRIYIYKGNAQVGFAENSKPGVEFVVQLANVKEGDELSVVVATETPYRIKGNSELFLFTDSGPKSTIYDRCQRIGASVASSAQMTDASNAGAQFCPESGQPGGWGADFFGYPSQAVSSNCGKTVIVQKSNESESWPVWCYGIKPKQDDESKKVFPSSIAKWFTPYNNSIPSQSGKPPMKSRYGEGGDYEAQSERGILLQWEMSSPDSISNRTIPFEPTIVQVDGLNAKNGNLQLLRKFGTFDKSSFFQSPRPTSTSKMLRNQFWIWGNKDTSQQTRFTVQVPGIFLDSYYEEDREVSSVGPLVGIASTANLLRTSPCLKEGQVAGRYSIECLTNLFVGSGGNPTKGKLATTNGGLTQLNSMGDMDNISEYLMGLYAIATTGRDSEGNKVGTTIKERTDIVNDAAQKMLGIDIASPCEEIKEDDRGNIIIVTKQGYKDAECLDYLWYNTGKDKSKGEDDWDRNISNTYESIGQRFSGLTSQEGTKASRTKYPFQTCQRLGSYSPKNVDGTPNRVNMDLANSKGGIPEIQRFYNSVYQRANNIKGPTDPGDQTTVTDQRNAIQQCYGLKKAIKIDFSPEGLWGKSGTSDKIQFMKIDPERQRTDQYWRLNSLPTSPLRQAFTIIKDTTPNKSYYKNPTNGFVNHWAVLGGQFGLGPSDQLVLKTDNLSTSENIFTVSDANEMVDRDGIVWNRLANIQMKNLGCFGGGAITSFMYTTGSPPGDPRSPQYMSRGGATQEARTQDCVNLMEATNFFCKNNPSSPYCPKDSEFKGYDVCAIRWGQTNIGRSYGRFKSNPGQPMDDYKVFGNTDCDLNGYTMQVTQVVGPSPGASWWDR